MAIAKTQDRLASAKMVIAKKEKLMKDKDRIFQLSSDLITLQKAYNQLLSERDEAVKRLEEAMEKIAAQEKLLDRSILFGKKPSRNPQS